jgi:hypothetical protein
MALYASWYFEEVHMEVLFAMLIAMLDALVAIAIVVFGACQRV